MYRIPETVVQRILRRRANPAAEGLAYFVFLSSIALSVRFQPCHA
jgi:hypothetical protein